MNDSGDDLLPDAPPSDYAPPAAAAPRSSMRMAALLGGIALLVGGSFFAVMVATGGGSPGPIGAVEALFGAVADEDVIGVLDALDPWERDALTDGIKGVTDEMRRLGILDDSLDLEGVAGVDIEFSDLEFEATPLTDDHVAVTLISGSATFTTQPDEIPLGSALGDLTAEVEPTTVTEPLDEPITLVAVRRNDSWHVSIGWSIAEAMRNESGAELRPTAEWFTGTGADTPEGVLTELAGALTSFDFTAAAGLLSPHELEPLFAFYPQWRQPLLDAQRDAADSGFSMSVENLTVKAHTDGDLARLGVDTMTATLAMDDTSITVDWDGECVTVDAVGELPINIDRGKRTCADEGLPFNPADTTFLTVEKIDGRWFLSPLRTVFDSMIQGLRAIPDDGFADGMEGFLGQGLGSLLWGSTTASSYAETGSAVEGSFGGGSAGVDYVCQEEFQHAIEQWITDAQSADGEPTPPPELSDYCS